MIDGPYRAAKGTNASAGERVSSADATRRRANAAPAVKLCSEFCAEYADLPWPTHPYVRRLWEYKLSGGVLLAPHIACLRARKLPHATERGVRRSPRADPPPSEHEV
eukprot:scaffold1708_cov117-Isochrysis_galbana.AAC.16